MSTGARTMIQETRLLMGMPITVGIIDEGTSPPLIDTVYAYFAAVEQRFSVFRIDSEVSRLNQGRLAADDYSADLREVLELAERTQRQSNGYFNICRPDGMVDPSGIVKGWAIHNAARILHDAGVDNFFVDAGGDIQTAGRNAEGEDWVVGIRSPFNPLQIIKTVHLKGRGIATSGTYVRGQHIYDPFAPSRPLEDIVSLTVIGTDVLEADRFATAAFAMGKDGIYLIEELPGLEGYAVDSNGVAVQTSGFWAYVA